nr:immunoglobulin light chain junction region [Macaca mulatta]MOW66674.1 immunoglobulin light chain junction region [Macaca mulatta]MOW67874.1 immunoglobulin light chain junction region [Macaca mulatta]MOW69972.1 immunoglobulin light chain junction region [Macaca mulatta]MOW70279.1 immunoglobulin light chain junction region [Macaca mulatta]
DYYCQMWDSGGDIF